MRVIRMISTEIYEPRGTEAYLEEMERKGYHLDAAGKLLFYFKRTGPQDMRYRVEYWKDELPDELIAQYKDCGWEYVAEIPRHVYIFRAPAGTPLPEPYDWEQRRDQYRRYMRTAVWVNVLLAAIVLAIITGLCIWAGVEAYFDPKGSWWLTITTAALILACVYTQEGTGRTWEKPNIPAIAACTVWDVGLRFWVSSCIWVHWAHSLQICSGNRSMTWQTLSRSRR